ncbi:hypothetical protein IKE72_02720 [Candidatus Saccharibacteria bacterium]|nr:hypothetical protein [Candidatus Saccharibacteria bacterium]
MRSLLFILVGVLFFSFPANAAVKVRRMEIKTKYTEKEIKKTDYSEYFSPEDVEILACTIHNEAGGIPSKMEQSAVAWCAINRFVQWGYNTLADVLRDPGQFASWYSAYTSEEYKLAEDVCKRATIEMNRDIPVNVGRTLPTEYLYFGGDGAHNHFRCEFASFGNYWDWSWGSPYAT